MASGGRAVFNIERKGWDLEARKAEAAAKEKATAPEGVPILQK
jgi:hypothetical protein